MTNNERLSYLKNIRLKELEEKNKNNIDELCEAPYLYEWEQEFLNCVKAKNLFEDKDK